MIVGLSLLARGTYEAYEALLTSTEALLLSPLRRGRLFWVISTKIHHGFWLSLALHQKSWTFLTGSSRSRFLPRPSLLLMVLLGLPVRDGPMCRITFCGCTSSPTPAACIHGSSSFLSDHFPIFVALSLDTDKPLGEQWVEKVRFYLWKSRVPLWSNITLP